MMIEITKEDLLCLLSAIKALEEEGYNEDFILPKKRLAVKLSVVVRDFDSLRTPKWLKQLRNPLNAKKE